MTQRRGPACLLHDYTVNFTQRKNVAAFVSLRVKLYFRLYQGGFSDRDAYIN